MRDAGRVERARRRLGGAAGAHDAVHLREGLAEAAGIGVVVGEAVDHAVRAVRQRDETGRREDAGLAHPATDQLARAARPPDDVARADDHGADRAAEALAQAERDGVGGVGEVARP